MILDHLKKDLLALTDPEKAVFFPKFFKTGKGQYGEGDQFIGVTVPNQRKIAKKYRNLPLPEIQKLLYSNIHEHRLIALLILVDQFDRGTAFEQEKIYHFYLSHKAQVNNWDLVDSSAHRIIGPYLADKDKSALVHLAHSQNLWDKRIAMLSTFAYIKNDQFDVALKIAEVLVQDSHDLIHKAVGWMLREIGKRDLVVEEGFLNKYAKIMPRTMLRYAIEKFSPKKKAFYMNANKQLPL